MTVRATSHAAYDLVKPTLGERQTFVLGMLRLLGSATDLELSNHLGWPINKITPRRGELVELGLVEARGTVSQNGRQAITWAVAKPPKQSRPRPGELF